MTKSSRRIRLATSLYGPPIAQYPNFLRELCKSYTKVTTDHDVRVAKRIDYAHWLGAGSIYRRLGYLLDLFGIGTHAELQSLRTALTATYVPLDPSLPSEGSHTGKWRLQLNIPADELLAVRST